MQPKKLISEHARILEDIEKYLRKNNLWKEEVTGKNKIMNNDQHWIISYKNIPIHFFIFLKLTLDCSMLEDKDPSAKSGSTVLKM